VQTRYGRDLAQSPGKQALGAIRRTAEVPRGLSAPNQDPPRSPSWSEQEQGWGGRCRADAADEGPG